MGTGPSSVFILVPVGSVLTSRAPGPEEHTASSQEVLAEWVGVGADPLAGDQDTLS